MPLPATSRSQKKLITTSQPFADRRSKAHFPKVCLYKHMILLCSKFNPLGVRKNKTRNHIIELVMAVGKFFHYLGDCGKIALFCNKNYTPHSFSVKRPSFSALNNTLSPPPQEIMACWKTKNQKKERLTMLYSPKEQS